MLQHGSVSALVAFHHRNLGLVNSAGQGQEVVVLVETLKIDLISPFADITRVNSYHFCQKELSLSHSQELETLLAHIKSRLKVTIKVGRRNCN